MNHSMMKLLPSLLMLAFAPSALAGGVNFASGTSPIYWKVPNVKYYVNPAGSEDITDGSDLDAVDESYSDWCDLPCSNIKANYSGTATTTNMLTNGNSNGNSEVTWVENAAWKYGSGVLGITSPLFYNDGTIIEADIALNGLHHTWTTANPFNKVDTKSIVLHEVGHWYGIQHYLLTDYPQNDPPTMTPAWSGTTQTRTLETQDTIPFCYLYGSKACSSDSDCPYVVGGSSGNEYIAGQYSCNGGQCTWDGGGGGSGGGTSGGGSPNSCEGICGQQAPSCYCDAQCEQYNDCCPDYVEICVNGGTSGGGEEEGGSEEEGGGGNGNCPDYLAFEGCCDGLVLTWCDNGNVQTLDCQNTCGWDGENGFYNCNVDPEPEPSGEFPLACGEGGTSSAEGGEEGGTTTTGGGNTEGGTETCEGGITFVGCCDGTTLTWCDQGSLNTLGCSGSCGWSQDKGYFDCNEPPQGDPSGEYPLVCPGGATQTTEESGGEEEGGEGVTSEESGGETPEESGGETPEESGGESAGTESGAEGTEEGAGETEGGTDLTGGGGEAAVEGSVGGGTTTTETPGGFVAPVGDNTPVIPSLGTSRKSEGCATNDGQTGGAMGLLMFALLLGLRQRKSTVL